MPTDFLKSMAVGQGYVPQSCTMPGQMVMGLVNGGQDPCTGCHEDRSKCKGRPYIEPKVLEQLNQEP